MAVLDIKGTVTVCRIVVSRYENNLRPIQWENRREGTDIVVLENGEEISLFSDGQQSPPKPGWKIVIYGKHEEGGFLLTLHGIEF